MREPSAPRDGEGNSLFRFQRGAWVAIAAPTLIFGGLAVKGASYPAPALFLALFGAVMTFGVLLDRTLRSELSLLRSLRAPGLLFLAVLVVVVLSLTPFAPGGLHPTWAYVDAPVGAATIDRSRTAMELMKLTGLACFFVLGLASGGDDRRARKALIIVLCLGAALALWSFFQVATAAFGPDQRRLQGPIENANGMATLLGMLFLGAIALTLRSARRGEALALTTRALPYAGLALIFLVCFMMTASRGGLAALAVGLIVFAGLQIFGGRAPSRQMWIAMAGLVGLAGVAALTGEQLVARIVEPGLAADARRVVLSTHWAAFQSSPIMGYGLGTFDLVNRIQTDAANLQQIRIFRAAHNVYLSWLELAGVLGAVPMFACIGVILLQTFRATIRRTRMTTVLFGLLAVNAVVLTHGLSDFALEIYAIAVLWSYLLGMQFSAAQGGTRR